MPRIDAITKRKPVFGHSRSKAMNATKRKFDLNLQKVTITEGTSKKTIRVTARTAKTLRKQGRIA